MKHINITELCEIQIGRTPKRLEKKYWGLGHSWLSIADMTEKYVSESKEEINDLAVEECRMRIVPQNTVVMSFKLTIGRLAITNKELYTNEAIAAFLIKDEDLLLPEYLYYSLKNYNFEHLIDRAAKGKTLNKRKLSEICIPLVSIEKQKRIIDILNNAENLLEKRQQQIESLSVLKQSLFFRMFFNDEITKKTSKLKDFIISSRNGLSRRGNDDLGDIVLKLKDIRDNEIDFTNLNKIKLSEKEMENYKVDEQDLLLVRVNGNPDYVGRNAIFEGYDENVYFNDHIIRLRLTNAINPKFLSYYLNSQYGLSEFRKQIKTSAGQYTINRRGIDNINITYPTRSIQDKLVNDFNEIDDRIENLTMGMNELSSLYDSLLYKAFNGELFKEEIKA